MVEITRGYNKEFYWIRLLLIQIILILQLQDLGVD